MGFLLTWQDNNISEDGHRVYRSMTTMDPNNLPAPVADLGADVTEYEDGGVVEGNTYYYRVSAYITGGSEVVSGEIMVTGA